MNTLKNRLAWRGLAALLLSVLWLGAGCESDDKYGSGPVAGGVDVSGEWQGEYEGPEGVIPLEARIEQNGGMIVISTTKVGDGHLMTGTISPGGTFFITDDGDAQSWTPDGAATATRMVLKDYINGPGSALRYIVLTR